MKKEAIKGILNKLKIQNNFRKLTSSNKTLINLSSNDYLGLGNDENLKEQFFQKGQPKLSSSSSRLMNGSYDEVLILEEKLQKIYGKAGIVFNSGFAANSSIIKTFYNKNSLIITDRLNHASIYDGIKASSAKFARYHHLDMNHLEELLKKNCQKYDDIVVISETIYSMDGDFCDLHKLVQLKQKYNFDLMIDEAHSYGVYGYGLVHELNLVDNIDFLIIPLGKGGGSIGSYVITSPLFKDYIINKSCEFIYSTANPPINNAWNLFLLEKMPIFFEQRKKLQKLVKFFLEILEKYQIHTDSKSHIISIIIGDNQKATLVAEQLKQNGFGIYAIKEPTIPKNTARLRISLNSTLKKEDLLHFAQLLSEKLK